jgi:Nucleotidyl transferase AbiEii toxin, Type IV TA system
MSSDIFRQVATDAPDNRPVSAFLELLPSDRLVACLEVKRSMGLDSTSVGKDFWVCWTLRELFNLPGVGEHFTFKGSRSLSKVWKLIKRFSEDIDIIVAKEVLGFGGEDAPDRPSGNKQRKVRIERLMESCCL